jgi:transposase-like protein
MNKITQKRHQVKTKIDVALEAIQGQKTMSEIASKFGVVATV